MVLFTGTSSEFTDDVLTERAPDLVTGALSHGYLTTGRGTETM